MDASTFPAMKFKLLFVSRYTALLANLVTNANRTRTVPVPNHAVGYVTIIFGYDTVREEIR